MTKKKRRARLRQLLAMRNYVARAINNRIDDPRRRDFDQFTWRLFQAMGALNEQLRQLDEADRLAKVPVKDPGEKWAHWLEKWPESDQLRRQAPTAA
jgi:hypothetical protein